MKTDRFETFVDAILAIIMTVLILKIPQPAEPTLTAIWDLHTIYIAYVLSFLIIFNIWYNNHNLFQIVENIDNMVIWLHGAILFVISVLPYFTIWLGNHMYSIPAETMFGLLFIVCNILSNLSILSVFRSDAYNKKLVNLNYSLRLNLIPLVVMFTGFIITYTVYIPGIYISCLISIVLWAVIGRINRIRGEASGE